MEHSFTVKTTVKCVLQVSKHKASQFFQCYLRAYLWCVGTSVLAHVSSGILDIYGIVPDR